MLTRSSCMALLPALALALLPSLGQAQTPTITVQNLAPSPRQDWAHAVIPFAPGTVPKLPEMHVGKGPTVWQPIGARWPDGSLRQALCFFPVQMTAMSELTLPIEKGPGMAIPEIAILDPLQTGEASLEIVIHGQGKITRAKPVYVKDIESNAARRVTLHRCRVGETGFVFELLLECYLGRKYAEAHISLFFSDPTTPAMEGHIDKVVVTAAGMRLILRHQTMFGVQTKLSAKGSRTTLLSKIKIGDGQGIRRTGVLTIPEDKLSAIEQISQKAATVTPILGATAWRTSKAYGPFGFVPDPPPFLRGAAGRSAFARRHAAFVRSLKTPGHPMQRLPHMLLKDPGATGDQADFGILKLAPVASTGTPSFLAEVEPSILQEACRPVHFFEADGSPVKSSAHPKWITWYCRTHWNCGVSPDRLGKPCPPKRFTKHGWVGKDRQHFSSNYLCGYYLLTGSPWAKREIENEVQLYLSGQTVHNAPTSGIGAARAAGRMLLAACWLYQCTGDPAIYKRIEDRLDRVYSKLWVGRESNPDRVRPLVLRRAARGQLDGTAQAWVPWEEAIAAIGFAAAHRLTGNVAARQLAGDIAINTLRHGWVVAGNQARVGYRVRYQPEGMPLDAEQQRSGWAKGRSDDFHFGGGGLALWSIGAVEIARHFAILRKDKPMQTKAETILAILRRGPARSVEGWWDKRLEWDAVRMGPSDAR